MNKKQKKIPMETSIVKIADLKTVNTKEESFDFIFAEDREYVVPVYQRAYEWGESQIDDFLKSIFEAKEYNIPLFMGTVQYTLEKGDSHKYEIIDGQQRMTTLILIIKLLELELEKLGVRENIRQNYNIKLTVKNYGTNQTYLENVLKLELNQIEKVNTEKKQKLEFQEINNQYYKNLYWIKTKLDVYKKEDKISDSIEFYEGLKDYIFDNIYFVKLVTVGLPLPQVVGIFNTINSTGLELNSSDLFKLQYYEYLRKEYPEENNDEENWMNKINACYEKLEEYKQEQIRKKQECQINMPKVLDILKHIIVAKYDMGWEQLSKGNETFYNELFDMKNSKRNDIAEVMKFESFQFLLDLFLDLYDALHNPDERLKGIAQEECLCENLIETTRYSRYWTIPYVGAYFECIKDEESKKEDVIIKYRCAMKRAAAISKYFIVNSINYDKVINPVQTFMCREVLPMLAKGEDITELIQCQLRKSPYDRQNETDEGKERFVERLAVNIFENSKRCSVLCVYSAILDEIKNGTSSGEIQKKIFSWRTNPYDIEHIYARNKFENEVEADEDTFHSIGNLVVLERGINRAIKDAEVKDKLQKYETSDYISVKEVREKVLKSKKWGKEEIEKRKKEKGEMIIQAIFGE